MNDYRSALDALKKAQQTNPSRTDSASLERDIRSIEEFIAAQSARK
jgi:hypothetical protein